ncbi:MAG: glycosyltransferase, partial [Kiritimatiellia bacterium]
MAKIVHMSSVHPPYDVRIFHKECGTLVRAGYAVTLIVAAPCDASRNGVNFVSVPAPVGRRERMTRTAGAIYRAALALDADLYHFHDAELIPVGLRLKLRGKRVIYDVHEELSHDILDKEWVPRALRPLLAAGAFCAERVAAVFFDGIIASRPALMGRFPGRKTCLVNNFPMLGELARPGSVPFTARPPVCAYVGGMSRERGLVEIVRALGYLPDEVALEVHVAGLIDPPELAEEVKKLPGWKRMRLLGWQSRGQVAELLNMARFGLVTFLPIANHVRSYPTKI